MSAKDDFTAEEWATLREGPVSAGFYVIAAHRGGSIRETFSLAGAYAEAATAAGSSPLVAAVAAEKPELEREKAHSMDEMREDLLANVRAAAAVADAKSPPEEAGAYKQWMLDLADRVANARREGFMGLTGERVGEDEREALRTVAEALGLPAPADAEEPAG